MPTRNVVLTEHQSNLIARLVESGHYQNASEVMREGLRLIERQESENAIRLKAMREAAEAGIADVAAGRYRTFDTADTLRDHLSEIVTEAFADLRPLTMSGSDRLPTLARARYGHCGKRHSKHSTVDA